MKLPQFSLRSLFVAVLLLAILLAGTVEILRLRRMNAALRQQKLAAEQQKALAEQDKADALSDKAAIQEDMRSLERALRRAMKENREKGTGGR
jgi:hypothetical protein